MGVLRPNLAQAARRALRGLEYAEILSQTAMPRQMHLIGGAVMVSSETASDAKDVLEDVLEQRRSREEWAEVDAEMRRLAEAIETGDDDRARSAVASLEKFARRLVFGLATDLTLDTAGGISPDAVEPPEGTVGIKNKIVGSL